MKFVLLVGGGCGATIIDCTSPEAAEEHRAAKARRERAVALVRPASPFEIDSGTPSPCLNHPLFGKRPLRYHCECGECQSSATK